MIVKLGKIKEKEADAVEIVKVIRNSAVALAYFGGAVIALVKLVH